MVWVRSDLVNNGKKMAMYIAEKGEYPASGFAALSTEDNGAYKLSFSGNSPYQSAAWCRTPTRVVIGAVSKSGQGLTYDSDAGGVVAVSGNATACATYDISSGTGNTVQTIKSSAGIFPNTVNS